MSAHEHSSGADSDIQQTLHQIEQILRGQLSGYARMQQCLEKKRDAIARADMAEIERICHHEQRISHSITELEKHRLTMVGKLTQTVSPHAEEPLSIHDMADLAEPDRRSRLLRVRDDLLAVVETVRRESGIVRQAAEALSRHMTGLIQTIQTSLSQAGVYGHRGRVQDGEQSRHAVDLRS